MILTCPKCATSYTIDEAQLGPEGRNVRCQSCRATWFATRAEDPIELVAPAPKPEPKAKPAREVKARELPKLYRQLMEDKKRLKAITNQGLIWGGMTLVFIAILGVAYGLRIDIVKAFPSSAKAFASVDPNIKNDVIGMRILLGRQKVGPSLKGGRFVFSVAMEVQNLKNEANPLAPMRVRLLDAHGGELSNSIVVLNDVVLTPRGTTTVNFDIPDPKNMAMGVDIGFDLMAMKELREKSRFDKYYKQAAKRTASEGEHGGGEEHGGSEGHGAAADAHGEEAPASAETSGHGELRPAVEPAAHELTQEAAHSEAPAMKPAVAAHH
jgi:predicted Zn finger-like uncharacterized protein